MTEVEKICNLLESAKADFIKAHKGQKAAATRGRKALSEIAVLCKSGRAELLAVAKGEQDPRDLTL